MAVRDRVLGGVLLVGAIAWFASAARGAVPYMGVNLAGAEFGATALPGTYNTHYTYPTSAEVDYFVGKGMNTFRVPFRWERLQQSLGGTLDSAELGHMDSFVNYATQQGAYVVLEPHNFARYYPDPSNFQSSAQGLIGGPDVSNADFADFWTRLADHYKGNDHVIFNLMNEPNAMVTEDWATAANAAIAGIRSTSASNLILVPGNQWTGAHSWVLPNDPDQDPNTPGKQSWYGTVNADAMRSITDPGNNYAFEVHQYLDSNSSGTSSQIMSETIGAERLADFTQWLIDNDLRGFLGEFAAANSTFGTDPTQIGDETIRNMLDHIEDNSDVWIGWTWWAAGPWWGEYMFTLEPTGSGDDRAAMGVLEEFLVPEPGTPALIGLVGLVLLRRRARSS